MHKSSHEKMKWFKETFLNEKNYLKVLDIGSLDTSGNNYNYKSIFNINKWVYEGLDFKNGDNVNILVEDIYNFPEVEDNSYDVVISGQLFEHLGFFWLTMGEIDRILKPGGFCCIIAPSSGPIHGSSDTDSYRFFEDGMKALAYYVNFEIIHVSTNNSEEANPWHDTCLVAKKKKTPDIPSTNLDDRIINLENKIDEIIDVIKK